MGKYCTASCHANREVSMWTPCRLSPGALLGMIGVLAACGGGDGTGPPTAGSVTGISGDNQTGPTGAQLEVPLGLVLLGSNGQPVSGVVVSWSVPIGQASLSQSQDTSDATGAVATGVTLGVQQGQLV